MAIPFKPEGHTTVTPYLLVNDVPKLIDFLQKAFDAKEIESMKGPDGRVAHAQVRIYDSVVMMGTAPAKDARPASFYVYVKDTDAIYQSALKAGGTSIMEPATMFYGDRNGGVKDPCDNQWWIATHVEDVSPEEIARRAASQPKRS